MAYLLSGVICTVIAIVMDCVGFFDYSKHHERSNEVIDLTCLSVCVMHKYSRLGYARKFESF